MSKTATWNVAIEWEMIVPIELGHRAVGANAKLTAAGNSYLQADLDNKQI